MRLRLRSGRVRRVVAASSCVALVGTTVSACFADASAMPAVRDFLIAWQVGNYQAAAKLTVGADEKTVSDALGQVRDQLDAASMKLGLGVAQPTGPKAADDKSESIRRDGDTARARFSVKIDLGENGEPFSYPGLMDLKRIKGKWKVVWSPSIIHPSLKDGQRLAVVTETPDRARVEEYNGRTLLRRVKADIVGVFPAQLTDPGKTIKQLAEAIKIDGKNLDAERLLGRVRSAPPHVLLPLVTLQRSEHVTLLARLRAIPGLHFKTVTTPIDATLAPELVGNLGPATADRLQQVGAPYQPGDTIGVSGIQLLQQRRLAGAPTVKVVVQGAGHTEVLREWKDDRKQPQKVRTFLDRRIQSRAQRALARLGVPASMIVVKSPTGAVQAVANHRTNGRNLALEGRYPPGHTFGIVTAETLLHRSGMSQKDKTDCPASVTVGGKAFTNPLPPRGQDTFQQTFGASCSTTLASLSGRFDGPALVQEAGLFGFGRDWGLSTPHFPGSVPVPANDAEKAEAAIGQGKVLASPLVMALTAGAIASGTWRPPLLLAEPQDRPTQQSNVLDAIPVGDLRLMMQRSVHSGTAKAAKIPGAVPVHGVVATVNYSVASQNKTVSWFVGFRGDTAFAIAIEGNIPAAQIAAKFLTLR